MADVMTTPAITIGAPSSPGLATLVPTAPVATCTQADGQLDRLLKYTTFHIGLYATMFTTLFGYLKFGSDVPHLLRAALLVGSGFVLLAGAAGGVIAGNLSHYRTYNEFMSARLRSRIARLVGLDNRWSYEGWSTVEHGAFWLGVLVIVPALMLSSAWPNRFMAPPT